MKRLTWLVGPPGAGKSTYAKGGTHGFHRVVEFNELLFPITRKTGISDGILTANNQLVPLIRNLELRKENLHERPLLVVAGMVSREILFPISGHEEVWLILPEKEAWIRQLTMRPNDRGEGKKYFENYNDIPFSELWYEEFTKWTELGFPIRKIEIAHVPALLGRRFYD